jgi:hypothetical protein
MISPVDADAIWVGMKHAKSRIAAIAVIKTLLLLFNVFVLIFFLSFPGI